MRIHDDDDDFVVWPANSVWDEERGFEVNAAQGVTLQNQRFAQVGTLRTDLQKSYDCNFCVNFCVNVAHCRKTTIFAIRNCVAFTKVSVNSIIWRKYQNWVALRQNKPYSLGSGTSLTARAKNPMRQKSLRAVTRTASRRRPRCDYL